MAIGTNTDPYQRPEGRYRLMPGIIGALADSGTPFSILTKGPLLRRDLPLLQRAKESVSIGIGVSLALTDPVLQQAVEPGTPLPQARLDLIKAVRDAGLPCGVFVAPILPGLSDAPEQLADLLGRLADVGATSASIIPLHLRPGTREWFMSWLAAEHPDLVTRYQRLYGRGSYVTAEYKQWLWNHAGPLLREFGFERSASEIRGEYGTTGALDGGDGVAGSGGGSGGSYPQGYIPAAGPTADPDAGPSALAAVTAVGEPALF